MAKKDPTKKKRGRPPNPKLSATTKIDPRFAGLMTMFKRPSRRPTKIEKAAELEAARSFLSVVFKNAEVLGQAYTLKGLSGDPQMLKDARKVIVADKAQREGLTGMGTAVQFNVMLFGGNNAPPPPPPIPTPHTIK